MATPNSPYVMTSMSSPIYTSLNVYLNSISMSSFCPLRSRRDARNQEVMSVLTQYLFTFSRKLRPSTMFMASKTK